MNYYLTQAGVNLLDESRKRKKALKKARRFKTAQDAEAAEKRVAELTPKEREVQTQLDKDNYDIRVNHPNIRPEVRAALHAHRGQEGCIGAACTAAIRASGQGTMRDTSKKEAQQAERGLATGQTTTTDWRTTGEAVRQKKSDRP